MSGTVLVYWIAATAVIFCLNWQIGRLGAQIVRTQTEVAELRRDLDSLSRKPDEGG